MAVKINTAQEAEGGLPIPAGSIATFATIFPSIELEVHLRFSIYKDIDTVKAKGSPIPNVVGIPLKHTLAMPLVDFAALDNAAIEVIAKDFIESFTGLGSCETVTKDQLQPDPDPE